MSYMVFTPNGDKFYYDNIDIAHNVNGPAILYSEKTMHLNPGLDKFYWIYYGKYVPCSSQKEFEKHLKLKIFW